MDMDYSKFRQNKRGHWKYCGIGVELLTPGRIKRARKTLFGVVPADWFPTWTARLKRDWVCLMCQRAYGRWDDILGKHVETVQNT